MQVIEAQSARSWSLTITSITSMIGRRDLALVGGCNDCEQCSRMAPRSGRRASYVVIALGSNVHIFARPHRRGELARCFETVLGSPVRTVEFPGIGQPMLVASFPGGGHLSIEFTDDAPMTNSRGSVPGSSCAPTTLLPCYRRRSTQDLPRLGTRATRITS
jgi:hypothetical protein